MIIYITGGQRSGKSTFAEQLLADKTDVCYIATARVDDPEMADRVRKHQARRPASWRTFEGDLDLVSALGEETYYLLDCLGNLVSDFLFDVSQGAPGHVGPSDSAVDGSGHDKTSQAEVDPAESDLASAEEAGWISKEAEAQAEALCKETLAALFERAQREGKTLVLVSNEVGSSLTPMSRLGRAFTDVLGRINQYAASQADQAYLLVSGLPVRLK